MGDNGVDENEELGGSCGMRILFNAVELAGTSRFQMQMQARMRSPCRCKTIIRSNFT